MDYINSTRQKAESKPSEPRNYKITTAQTGLDTPPQKSPEWIQRSIQAIPNHYLQTYETYIINKKSELLISITGIARLYLFATKPYFVVTEKHQSCCKKLKI
jgi:hypothetical protein